MESPMKKSFRIKIGGEEMRITVERQGDELLVERDGESYRVTVLPPESPPVDGDSHSSAAAPDRPVPSSSGIAAGSTTTSAPRTGPTETPLPSGGGSGVPAPITGMIKEVLVNAGERISAGERVMMMEAMKMDIEVLAPASGTVAQVFVAAGDSVRENQPLFRIE